MIKKSLVLAISSVLTLPAVASTNLTFSEHLQARKVDSIIKDNEKKADWLSSQFYTHSERAKMIQTFSRKYPERISESQDLMIEMLNNAGVLSGVHWVENDYLGKLSIKGNRSLIDTDRLLIGNIIEKTEKSKYTTQLVYSDQTIDNYMSSTLMAHGEPPPGPDGAQIKICRMFPNDNASYFEMSETQSVLVYNAIQSSMSLSEACLNKDSKNVSLYWKKRLGDFIDENGVFID